MTETLDEAIEVARRRKPFRQPPSIEDLMSGKSKPRSVEEQIADQKNYDRLLDKLEILMTAWKEYPAVTEAMVRRDARRAIIKYAYETKDDDLGYWCSWMVKSSKAIKVAILARQAGNQETFRKAMRAFDLVGAQIDLLEKRFRPPSALVGFWRFGLEDYDEFSEVSQE